jgi:hypothetical protein
MFLTTYVTGPGLLADVSCCRLIVRLLRGGALVGALLHSCLPLPSLPSDLARNRLPVLLKVVDALSNMTLNRRDTNMNLSFNTLPLG